MRPSRFGSMLGILGSTGRKLAFMPMTPMSGRILSKLVVYLEQV